MIVCATILRKKQVLLVKHSHKEKSDFGDWLLPAGRLEAGESLEEALRREIEEELGLEVEIVQKIIEHIDPYTGDNLTNFLCIPLTSEIRISAELTEARWFGLNEVKNIKNIHSGLKQFLINGLKSNCTSTLDPSRFGQIRCCNQTSDIRGNWKFSVLWHTRRSRVQFVTQFS